MRMSFFWPRAWNIYPYWTFLQFSSIFKLKFEFIVNIKNLLYNFKFDLIKHFVCKFIGVKRVCKLIVQTPWNLNEFQSPMCFVFFYLVRESKVGAWYEENSRVCNNNNNEADRAQDDATTPHTCWVCFDRWPVTRASWKLRILWKTHWKTFLYVKNNN